MADENLFYRLRSLDRLLGDKWQENDGKSGELAKQEIYFASPSELNDPMEGFSNIVFKGDKIVWHNFLNIILSVWRECLSFILFVEKKKIF